MIISVELAIELDEKDLAALAAIHAKGPTNRKLPKDAVVEFWGSAIGKFVMFTREQNRRYAAMTTEERAEFEARIAKPKK